MRAIIPERYRRSIVRALVVSNMLPDEAHPERGQFVRDQVAALSALDDLDVTLHEFPRGLAALARAPVQLRRRGRFDVVHAHFGLTAWPALAVDAPVRALTIHGTDVRASRTRLATHAVLGRIDLLAAVSDALVAEIPGARNRERALVLPCGVDTARFAPSDRGAARAELGLDPGGRYLLLPSDPSRPEKRADRARELAAAAGAELMTLGGVPPARVPLWVNAADAVVVPSDREGFGLAVLEALACNVAVAATPVGIHPRALEGVAGTLCAEFDVQRWRAVLEPHLVAHDSRVAGRTGAERWSARAMAERVADAWRDPGAGPVSMNRL
jgi:glycosyltransferase involved in cell wall biosynthesis